MNRRPVSFPPAAFEEEPSMPGAPAAQPQMQAGMQPPGMQQDPRQMQQAAMRQAAMQAPMQRPDAGARRLDYEGLRAELNTLLQQGKLPAGFDIVSAVQDRVFLKLLLELPAYAAVRVYMAEQRAGHAEQAAMQQLLTRLNARQGLPKPSRANAASASRDYMSMSPAEFARLEREYKEKARNGIKVKL